MPPRRALVFVLLATSGCTLISLDSLQDGSGATSAGGAGSGGSAEGGAGNQAGGPLGGSSEGGSTSQGGNPGVGGGPPLSYEDCILADDPAIYLKMTGDAAEPNLGSLGGQATSVGVFGPAAPLVDGSDGGATFGTAAASDYAGYPGASALFGGFEPFTIELWMSVPTLLDTRDLFRFANAADRLTLEVVERQVADGDDAFRFRIRNSAAAERGVTFFLNLQDPAGQVHHVVGVYRQTAGTMFDGSGNADDMVLYLDGAPIPLDATGDEIPMPTVTGTLQLGAGFAGVIDELAVYDRELSAADVERHYELGTGAIPCVP
jgi:hypothetical protein